MNHALPRSERTSVSRGSSLRKDDCCLVVGLLQMHGLFVVGARRKSLVVCVGQKDDDALTIGRVDKIVVPR